MSGLLRRSFISQHYRCGATSGLYGTWLAPRTVCTLRLPVVSARVPLLAAQRRWSMPPPPQSHLLLLTRSIRDPRKYKRPTKYTNFAHPVKATPFGLAYYFVLICGLGFTLLPRDCWIFTKFNSKLSAASPTSVPVDGGGGGGGGGGGEQQAVDDVSGAIDKTKKKRVTFRDKRFIEYETRVRNYSTPDKIFRYFATLRSIGESQEIYMTPDDFVRSITPGMKQPEGLGLDQFKRFDPKRDRQKEVLECGLRKDSIFYTLGENGLIAFTDYMFLLVVLSTPPRQFEIAFKMFDLDGDGNVDYNEFNQVREMARARTAVGQRHRDHAVTGSTLKSMSSALNSYFFGPDLDRKLTFERFLDFQKRLFQDVLWLEFNRYEPEDGLISERDFAASLLDYAQLPTNRKTRMLKRVRRAFRHEDADEATPDDGDDSKTATAAAAAVKGKEADDDSTPRKDPKGISFAEYADFFEVLKSINDIDTALMFYTLAGASIDKDTLKHVAKTVAGVSLSDHLVDVVFILFDENDDNELSNREFVSVMKRRLMRGLDKNKDTGLTKLLSAMWRCAKMDILSGSR